MGHGIQCGRGAAGRHVRRRWRLDHEWWRRRCGRRWWLLWLLRRRHHYGPSHPLHRLLLHPLLLLSLMPWGSFFGWRWPLSWLLLRDLLCLLRRLLLLLLQVLGQMRWGPLFGRWWWHWLRRLLLLSLLILPGK